MDKNYKILYIIVLSLLTAQWSILGLAAVAALILMNLTFDTTFQGVPFNGRIILSSYSIIGAIALFTTAFVNFSLLIQLFSGKHSKVNTIILVTAAIGMLIILVNSIKNILAGWEDFGFPKGVLLFVILLQLGILAILFRKQSRRVF